MSMNCGGYDSSIFVNVPAEHFVCPICLNILNYPQSCSNGHNYCDGCIKNSLLTKNSCPVCKVSISHGKLTRNILVQSLVEEMKTVCNSCSINGVPDVCRWTGNVLERKEHLDKNCAFSFITCPVDGCGLKCFRRDMTNHVISHLTSPVPSSSSPRVEEAHAVNVNRFDQLQGFDSPIDVDTDRLQHRAENEELLALYQSDDPLLRLPHKVELIWRLVDDLGFDLNNVATMLHETRCQSVFGFIYLSRYAQLGLNYEEVPNEVLYRGRNDDDVLLVAMINSLVDDMHHDRLEVYDALVFDWCKTTENVIEVLALSLSREDISLADGPPTATRTYMLSVAPVRPGDIQLKTMVKKYTSSRVNPERDLPTAESVEHLGRNSLIDILLRYDLIGEYQKTLCTSELRMKYLEFLDAYKVVV